MTKKKEPKVELVPITSIRPHPRNYRRHPEEQIKHIAASITQHGFYRNVVVARDGTILAGHGVVEASLKLKLESVPVIRVDVDPMSASALKILTSDNELGRFAEDDDRALTELLREIKDLDPESLLGTGYDDAQLAALLMVTRPAAEIRGMDEAKEWLGLPDYQEDDGEKFQLIVTFDTEEQRAEFVKAKAIPILKRQRVTWSSRWPNAEREDAHSFRFKADGSKPPEKLTTDVPTTSRIIPKRGAKVEPATTDVPAVEVAK